MEIVKKKSGKSGVQIKPFQIKNHMWLFVNCLIENPTFDSQTKENMTLQTKSFGSTCTLSEKFIGQVRKVFSMLFVSCHALCPSIIVSNVFSLTFIY